MLPQTQNLSPALLTELANLPANGRYSWEHKATAAQLYNQTGNMRLVSDQTGIPYDTLCDWKKSSWWGSIMDEIKIAKKAKQNTKIEELVATSLDLLQERINHGDWILNNKTGELVRKPITLRDMGAVVNALMTRQLQMEEMSERMEHRKETVQDTLNMLAKEFAKMNRTKNKQDAIDVEVKEVDNAIYDERQTGLQEGSGEIYEQTGS